MIKIEGADKSFESCQDCVHAYDSTEICILRRCIHAFSELRECYKPKKELKPSAQPETHEERTETHACDLIDRQQVLNLFPTHDWKHLYDAVKDLPSAQPESCVDTIDALDESIKHFDDMAEECRRNANIERNDYMDMRDDAAEYRQLSIWLNELKWLRERFQSQPEPCEDTISRKAAIDALKKQMSDWNDDYNVPVRKSIENIERLPSAQPEMNLDEWCTDCKEYDHKRHCCPRWNRVIRQTLKDMKEEQPEPHWNNHTVACLLADLYGDTCACNYSDISEWLPEKCEVIDACPNPVGVACWEQFLMHREGKDGKQN